MDKSATMDVLAGRAVAARHLSFGGGGAVRKPMRAAAAIAEARLRAEVCPATVTALLGGPEVDLLIGLDATDDVRFAYVGLDSAGLAPNFRQAREHARITALELSENILLTALDARVRRLPFLPTRSGLGTDLLGQPGWPYPTFSCPVTGDPLLAVTPLQIDVAVLHVGLADRRGNCLVRGDSFADRLLATAADEVWVTAEQVVDRLPPAVDRPQGTWIPRMLVDGVVESPGGGGFTGWGADAPTDWVAAREYQRCAGERSWLEEYSRNLLHRVSTGTAA